MSRNQKPITAQVRANLEVDNIIVLEALKKDDALGKTLEKLLEESPTFQKKKQELNHFKST